MKTCPHCNFQDYEAHSCPQCRANDRDLARGRHLGRCLRCDVTAVLASNLECRRCLRVQGLRQCAECHEVKHADIEFTPHKNTCRGCTRPGHKDPLVTKYGITQEDYDRALHQQNGRCAICGVSVRLVIDHDHRTKKFRGLLCGGCNIGLGCFKDSKTSLNAAVGYLEERTHPVDPEHAGPRDDLEVWIAAQQEIQELQHQISILNQKVKAAEACATAIPLGQLAESLKKRTIR